MLPIEGPIPERLKRLFYFRLLSEAQLDALAALCTLLKVEAGTLIFLEGDPAEAFFIVLSGKVQIYKTSLEGKEMILHLFGAGEMFAEVPIFSGIPRYPANALCLENAQVLRIDGPGFHQLVSLNPELALNLLVVFAKRLHHFNDLIEDLSLRTVDSRLAKYLLSLSDNASNQAIIRINKKTLAAVLGTVPETLSRSFKKLTQENLLRMERAPPFICWIVMA